jgi:2-polyprenyl-6-methoxyphenol hydroxylase-like FAD-dependent oxidoreductase
MKRGMPTADCCIAGCGPAGAVLALLLARTGVRVAVFEKHLDFLRDFRGDTVHPTTLELLDALGLAEKFLALPHTRVDRGALQVFGRRVELDLRSAGGKFPFVAFVPQWDFLDFIVREARAYPNFHLQMGAEGLGLLQEGDVITGLRWRDQAGREHLQRAALTVAADGRGSALREAAGLPLENQGSALDVLWFRLPRSGAEDEPLGLRAAPGVIVAYFPRGDFWQVGYVIPKGALAAVQERGLEALRAAVAEVAPELSGGLGTLTDFEQVKLLSVRADRLARWWKPGFLAIGDAAHAMSPVAGVGINMAIQDAVAAANALWQPLVRGEVRDTDLARVQRERLPRTRRVQRVQRYIERALLEKAVAHDTRLPLLARLMLRIPSLRRLPLRFMFRGFGRRVEAPPERRAA